MKIFFTGGTGFVGTYLARGLLQRGHEITILARSPGEGKGLPPQVSLIGGNPAVPGDWQEKLREHDAVINLAGASIFTRWNKETRKIIRDSRILTIRNVVNGLAEGDGKKYILISTSAVGYYGSRDDDVVLDENGPPGNDFLAQVCREWEAEAQKAEKFGVRVVRTRFGIVLGRNGGSLDQMVTMFNRRMGSPLGSGKQWFSWIHQEDLLQIMIFLLERKDLSGPVNCTAPHPLRNRELSQILAQVLNKTLLPAAPGFIIKAVLGEFGDVILKGQRVVPKRLQEQGFVFRFPIFREAVVDLLGKPS